jgi:hypothetical protein
MTRILPPLFVLLAAAPAAAAERRYSVTDFDRVQIDGPFQVSLKTGGSNSAKASGGSAAIERVAIDVQGRTLRIRQNRSAWGGYPGEAAGPLRIELTTHDLRGASVGGSGSLSIDKASAMRFDVGLAGSGQIALGSIQADMLVVGLSGSGTIKLAGKAKSLKAAVQGAGSLEAGALGVDDAQINAQTAGRVEVGVRRAATVVNAGQGDTRILGTPSCNVKQLGSGQVFCGNSDQGQR